MRTFKVWLPLAIVITIFSGLIYVLIQQSYRQGANDPQLQFAHDIADALAKGESPYSVLPSGRVNITTSLAPYVVVYDQAITPIAGNGYLQEVLPQPPKGIFEFAATQGENRRTWEPEEGVRQAVVVVPYQGAQKGFVMAGRSLSEIEKREAKASSAVFLAWASSMVATFIAVLLFA